MSEFAGSAKGLHIAIFTLTFGDPLGGGAADGVWDTSEFVNLVTHFLLAGASNIARTWGAAAGSVLVLVTWEGAFALSLGAREVLAAGLRQGIAAHVILGQAKPVFRLHVGGIALTPFISIPSIPSISRIYMCISTNCIFHTLVVVFVAKCSMNSNTLLFEIIISGFS
jgi:hypothetical protein